LIQQNVDGSANNFFNRSWAEFKVGFGDASGNYWLGNELLSGLTVNGSYKLKFDLQQLDTDGWYFAEYYNFRVLNETDNYALEVYGYAGDAGDAFGYSDGAMFSTYDRNSDQYTTELNMAAYSGAGFWYNGIALCLVNADRGFWASLPGGQYLQTSRMWLECK